MDYYTLHLPREAVQAALAPVEDDTPAFAEDHPAEAAAYAHRLNNRKGKRHGS